MKKKHSNYVMKTAADKKILNGENEFISKAVDNYFEANKAPLQLSVVSYQLLRFVYGLRKKE